MASSTLVGSSRRATELYLRHFLSHWSYDKDLWTAEEIAEYVEAFSQPGALRGGFNCYRAAFRGGWAPQGDPKIHAPTLVLWGQHDRLIPLAHGEYYAEHIPAARLETLDCGHMLPFEKPEEFAQRVTAFVRA